MARVDDLWNGALSHTGYNLHDALLTADLRAVEVHQMTRHGSRGYLEAIDRLLDCAGSG